MVARERNDRPMVSAVGATEEETRRAFLRKRDQWRDLIERTESQDANSA